MLHLICILHCIELEFVDNLYLHITLNYCAHEQMQKAHGLQLIGMANINTAFMTLVDLAKQFEA